MKVRLNRLGKRPDPYPITSASVILPEPRDGTDPITLLPPYRFWSDNADIPAKTVMGIGPQSGTRLHEMLNLGSTILPGAKRYLEMGEQNPVGVLPRVLATMPRVSWDEPYAINPSVEVV